jgi:hypothetical protein
VIYTRQGINSVSGLVILTNILIEYVVLGIVCGSMDTLNSVVYKKNIVKPLSESHNKHPYSGE